MSFGYDSRSRMTSRTDSEGRSRTYAYNPDSRLSSVTDSDGRKIQYLYDGLDRLTDCTVTKDGVQLLRTSQRYNTSGQTTSQSWTMGGQTYTRTYTYDTAKNAIPDGLLTSMTTGAGDTLNYTYDALGRLTGIDGKTGRAYTYAAGTTGTTTRISGYTVGFGGTNRLTSQFTYDAAGNITQETTGGKIWTYTYDALGQLTGASDGTTTYSFTYDAAGNLLTASDGSETHRYTYGDESWKDLLTAYDGHAISYDGSGNPTTYYNGRDWSFTWTGGRTLSGASNTKGEAETTMSYGYDLDGVRTEKTVTTHTLHTHAYQEDRVVAPTCTRSGYTVLKCACGTEKRTDYVNPTGHSYLYSKTVEPTCTENGYKLYVCTVCGDTTTRDVTEPLGHDYGSKWNLKQVCQRCGKPASIIPTDPIPVDPKPTDVIADVEEEPDELLLPTESDTVVIEKQTVSSYLYASGKLLQEKVTIDGKTETHNFFYDNNGTPYAMQVDGTTYYYITNLQGDVMELVDASGNTVASYTYSPYGQVLTAEGTLADKNPLRYRGYYYDTESGLYYLQTRYYDPNTGRFINADEYAGTGQGVLGYNMFAYCNNTPIQFKDQAGTACVDVYHSGSEAVTGTVGCLRDVTQEVDAALREAIQDGEMWCAEANTAFTRGSFADAPVNLGLAVRSSAYGDFYRKVNHGAPWDIKLKKPWNATIKTTYPGATYAPVLYHGQIMTLEDLGNYTYGVIGKAYSIPLGILFAGSYLAAGCPISGSKLANERNDRIYIEFGYFSHY